MPMAPFAMTMAIVGFLDKGVGAGMDAVEATHCSVGCSCETECDRRDCDRSKNRFHDSLLELAAICGQSPKLKLSLSKPAAQQRIFLPTQRHAWRDESEVKLMRSTRGTYPFVWSCSSLLSFMLMNDGEH
jgi:hypothetical protein